MSGTPQLSRAFLLCTLLRPISWVSNLSVRSQQIVLCCHHYPCFTCSHLNHGPEAEQTIRHTAKIRPMLSLHLTQTYISSISRRARSPPHLSYHCLNTISIHAYPPLSLWYPPEKEKTTPTCTAVRSRFFFFQSTDIHTSAYS